MDIREVDYYGLQVSIIPDEKVEGKEIFHTSDYSLFKVKIKNNSQQSRQGAIVLTWSLGGCVSAMSFPFKIQGKGELTCDIPEYWLSEPGTVVYRLFCLERPEKLLDGLKPKYYYGKPIEYNRRFIESVTLDIWKQIAGGNFANFRTLCHYSVRDRATAEHEEEVRKHENMLMKRESEQMETQNKLMERENELMKRESEQMETQNKLMERENELMKRESEQMETQNKLMKSQNILIGTMLFFTAIIVILKVLEYIHWI